MSTRFLRFVIAIAAVTAVGHAQTFERRASITGGNPAEGRCVVGLTVDGSAEVEIRGDNIAVRNLKGQTPSLDSFECTTPMPPNPFDFRFVGVQGRGSQQLVQPPRGSGVAAIHIDDPENGAGRYVFEIHWAGGPPMQPGPAMTMQAPPRVDRFGTDDAVRLCQSYVRDQAAQRFRANDVVFRRTMMDDQPGRSEWVKGFFEARGGEGQPRTFQFACSVNFATGQVRSADVTPMRGDTAMAYGGPGSGRAIQACEVSVEQRLTQDGYRRIDFGSVRMDERPGRGEFVLGAASALDHDRPAWFDFSCSADLRNGSVRSADVTRR